MAKKKQPEKKKVSTDGIMGLHGSTLEQPIYGEHYEGIFQFTHHAEGCEAADNHIFTTLLP